MTNLEKSNIFSEMCRPRTETRHLPRPLHRGTLSHSRLSPPGPVGIAQPQSGQSGATSAAPPPAFGQRVLDFARQHVSQRVGDGECFALADEALRNASAGSASDFGRVGAHTDYHWSSRRVSAADAQPGDIVQFRRYVITTVTRTVNADGSSREFTETETRGAPNHTAVVVSNDGHGNLTILEQNVDIGGTTGQAQKTVRQNRIATSAGSHQSGTTTVTVRISGRLVVYRPTARPSTPHPTAATHHRGHPRHGRH